MDAEHRTRTRDTGQDTAQETRDTEYGTQDTGHETQDAGHGTRGTGHGGAICGGEQQEDTSCAGPPQRITRAQLRTYVAHESKTEHEFPVGGSRMISFSQPPKIAHDTFSLEALKAPRRFDDI